MNSKIFYIDLFSGAGGTTTGIHLVGDNVEVVACVNHDTQAIESHKANHPDCLHFVEDVRDLKVIAALKKLVEKLRREHPGCIINLWASLECTNYSKAKGGLPRDADSRTLAHVLYKYIEELNPDYVFIENVREFMSWGPLDEKGKPVSRLNGRDYIRWIKKMCSYGYRYDYKLFNSADFGAYTSRERYFGQFSKHGLPNVWPEPTHTRRVVEGGLFEAKEQWKAVREVLDLKDEGKSIFNRKPHVEATHKRIYAGLIKFVAGGEKAFTKVYNSSNDVNRVKSLSEPIGTLTTQNSHALVNCNFIMKNYSGHPISKVHDLNRPAGTITTIDHNSIVKPIFLTSYYGNGGSHNINEPCPTITTKDRFAKVEPQFFTNYYSGGGQHTSIKKPSPTVTGIPKQRLTTCKFIDQQYGSSKPSGIDEPVNTLTANPKFGLVTSNYLVNPQFSSKGSSIDKPCFTLIARMDKRPPSLASVNSVDGNHKIRVIWTNKKNPAATSVKDGYINYFFSYYDNPTMIKIKEFMILYALIDIKMRMLKILELLLIQGFPANYELKGTQTEQKKFIGNAVVPAVAKAIAQANAQALTEYISKEVAV